MQESKRKTRKLFDRTPLALKKETQLVSRQFYFFSK